MADPYVPDPYIEIAWGFNVYNPPSTTDWVDITDDVLEVHTSRGRDSEFDSFPPGEATFVLINDDRRYDPLNTSGPNYGDLLQGVPIRVRADISGTKYDIWAGFIDGWPASYSEGGFERDMEVHASGIFKYLGERNAPDTFLQDISTLSGVFDVSSNGIIRRWYRLNEVRPGEQKLVDSMGNGTTDLPVFAKWDNQETITAASVLPALGLAQFQAPADTDNVYKGAGAKIGPIENSPLQTDQWVAAMVLRITDKGEMGGFTCSLASILNHVPGAPGFTFMFDLSIHQGGQHHPSAGVCPGCLVAQVKTGGTGMSIVTGPGGINDLTGSQPLAPGTFNPFDGVAHSIVFWRHGTTIELWADGVKVGFITAGGATGLPTWDPGFELRLYWPFQGVAISAGRNFPGVVMQDLIFFDSVNLGAFDPIELHETLMIGMTERVVAGAAAQHLMSRVGLNILSQQFIDSDTEVLVDAPANPHGSTVLDLLQSYADAEDGRLLEDKTGRVWFQSATRFLTQVVESTVQYTFTDTTSASVGIDGDLRVVLDDAFVYEAAEVTREHGITQHASTTDTPKRTYSLTDLKVTSDLQAQRRAEKIVYKYGTAKPRTDSWDVWPEANPSDWAAILGLDIGHRVRLIVTPANVGSQIDIQQHIELIQHHITPTDWVITMNGSPVDSSTYFKWGGVGATEGWGAGVWR